jgi:hypothetical protein
VGQYDETSDDIPEYDIDVPQDHSTTGVYVDFENTGNAVWEAGHVALGVKRYYPQGETHCWTNSDYPSSSIWRWIGNEMGPNGQLIDDDVFDPDNGHWGWSGDNEEIVSLLETDIQPGETARFRFAVYANPAQGVSSSTICDEHFVLLYKDGDTWQEMDASENGNAQGKATAWWRIKDVQPEDPNKPFFAKDYEAKWVSQTQAGTADQYFDVKPGDVVDFEAVFQNIGVTDWLGSGESQVCIGIYKDPEVQSAPSWSGYNSPVRGESWWYHESWEIEAYRITCIEETVVPSGKNGTFKMKFKIPEDTPSGKYREDISLAAGPYWIRNPINGDPFGTAHIWIGFDVHGDANLKEGDKVSHHTTRWPGYTFRRSDVVIVNVNLPTNFNPDTDSLRWTIKAPNQNEFVQEPGLSILEGPVENQMRTDWITFPGNVPVGSYALKVSAYRNTAEGSAFLFSRVTPDFYEIFNPWSEYDTDVHRSDFSPKELQWYAESGISYGYYGGKISWHLGPYRDEVFLPAIGEIAGERSAHIAMGKLVNKTKWDDGSPAASEILDGCWEGCKGPLFPQGNIPNLISWWNNGKHHPYGQCMHFGALASAFARAVGIPARMVTCIECKGWNFHVWSEVWLNANDSSEWSVVDGAYQMGPMTRQNPFVQDEVSTSTGIFIYDAQTGHKQDILGEYQPSPLVNQPSLTKISSSEAITLLVGTYRALYNFGDTVTILITTTNSSTSDFSGKLKMNVSILNYAETHEFHTYPTRTVTIPAGGTGVETYMLSLPQYRWNGDFLVSANLDTALAQSEFSIKDGLDLKVLATGEDILVGDLVTISFYMTNTLPVPISDLDLQAYFPAMLNDAPTPVYVTLLSLAAGDVYTALWTMYASEPGTQTVQVLASSPDAGYDQVQTSLKVLDYANLRVQADVPDQVTPNAPFTTTVQVSNWGDLPATDVQIALSLSDGMTSTAPLTVSAGDIEAGAGQTISWPLTASRAGVYGLRAVATETSVANEGITDQFVIAVQHPHTLTLETSRHTVTHSNPVTLTVTVENFGEVQDKVRVEAVSHNPDIGFTMYENGAPLTSTVSVPARGTHDLFLAIYPQPAEHGIITIKAVSQLDPTATDYVTITVSTGSRVYLPVVLRH